MYKLLHYIMQNCICFFHYMWWMLHCFTICHEILNCLTPLLIVFCNADKDECAVATDNGCYSMEFCTNTIGSYICSCPEKFNLKADGRTCQCKSYPLVHKRRGYSTIPPPTPICKGVVPSKPCNEVPVPRKLKMMIAWKWNSKWLYLGI